MGNRRMAARAVERKRSSSTMGGRERCSMEEQWDKVVRVGVAAESWRAEMESYPLGKRGGSGKRRGSTGRNERGRL